MSAAFVRTHHCCMVSDGGQSIQAPNGDSINALGSANALTCDHSHDRRPNATDCVAAIEETDAAPTTEVTLETQAAAVYTARVTGLSTAHGPQQSNGHTCSMCSLVPHGAVPLMSLLPWHMKNPPEELPHVDAARHDDSGQDTQLKSGGAIGVVVDGLAVEGVPVDGAGVDGVPVDGAAVEGVPVDGAGVDGSAVEQVPQL